ncbi:hypothetical protein D3C83_34750 [compost metagenome]
MTAMTAGSSTSRTIGVMSLIVAFASLRTSGLVVQLPVNTAMACASPFFSFTMKAIAVSPPPPVLLTTCSRTGARLFFSMIAEIARASTSPPPPGPVWVMNSIGWVGLNCPSAGPAPNAATAETIKKHNC